MGRRTGAAQAPAQALGTSALGARHWTIATPGVGEPTSQGGANGEGACLSACGRNGAGGQSGPRSDRGAVPGRGPGQAQRPVRGGGSPSVHRHGACAAAVDAASITAARTGRCWSAALAALRWRGPRGRRIGQRADAQSAPRRPISPAAGVRRPGAQVIEPPTPCCPRVATGSHDRGRQIGSDAPRALPGTLGAAGVSASPLAPGVGGGARSSALSAPPWAPVQGRGRVTTSP